MIQIRFLLFFFPVFIFFSPYFPLPFPFTKFIFFPINLWGRESSLQPFFSFTPFPFLPLPFILSPFSCLSFPLLYKYSIIDFLSYTFFFLSLPFIFPFPSPLLPSLHPFYLPSFSLSFPHPFPFPNLIFSPSVDGEEDLAYFLFFFNFPP